MHLLVLQYLIRHRALQVTVERHPDTDPHVPPMYDIHGRVILPSYPPRGIHLERSA